MLEIDPSSVKALFRRGKCQLALDKWDAAKESFRKVLELDDGNMEARRGLQSVRVKMQAQKEKEKKLAAVLKSNCRGASHAIDATPARWRDSPIDCTQALCGQEAVRRQGPAPEEGSSCGVLRRAGGGCVLSAAAARSLRGAVSGPLLINL